MEQNPSPFASRIVMGFDTVPVSAVQGEPLVNEDTGALIRKGMALAVQWEEGTGRRAQTEGISLFLKTGTAGKSPYNSILMGLV